MYRVWDHAVFNEVTGSSHVVIEPMISLCLKHLMPYEKRLSNFRHTDEVTGDGFVPLYVGWMATTQTKQLVLDIGTVLSSTRSQDRATSRSNLMIDLRLKRLLPHAEWLPDFTHASEVMGWRVLVLSGAGWMVTAQTGQLVLGMGRNTLEGQKVVTGKKKRTCDWKVEEEEAE